MSVFSQKTLDERRAGRLRLQNELRMSIVENGAEDLRQRFSPKAIAAAGVRYDEVNERWTVDVVVHTAAKTNMSLEDDLMNFPSDKLIAQIALVT